MKKEEKEKKKKELRHSTKLIVLKQLFPEDSRSGGAADSYPRIPVTRKWRLPWILVQLMKLSMLLESTVCLCSAPVPSHTAGVARHHC